MPLSISALPSAEMIKMHGRKSMLIIPPCMKLLGEQKMMSPLFKVYSLSFMVAQHCPSSTRRMMLDSLMMLLGAFWVFCTLFVRAMYLSL